MVLMVPTPTSATSTQAMTPPTPEAVDLVPVLALTLQDRQE